MRVALTKPPSLNVIFNLYVAYTVQSAQTWLPLVRKKSGKKINFSRTGNCHGILNFNRENGNFERSQEKVTMVRENFDFLSTIFGKHQYPVTTVQ